MTMFLLMILACSGADVIIKIQLPDKSNAPIQYRAPFIPALVRVSQWKLFNACCQILVWIECAWLAWASIPAAVEMPAEAIRNTGLLSVAVLALTFALRTTIRGLWITTASLLLSIQFLTPTDSLRDGEAVMFLFIAWSLWAMVVVALQERALIPKTEIIRDWMIYLHLMMLCFIGPESYLTDGIWNWDSPAQASCLYQVEIIRTRDLSLLLIVPCLLATLKENTRCFQIGPPEDQG